MKRYTDYADQQTIIRLRGEGSSYSKIVKETGWSYETVRKLCRRKLPQTAQKMGRPAKGLLSSFDPRVRFACLKIKRRHRCWGPDVVRAELAKREWAPEVKLPGASQIGAYFSQFKGRLVKVRSHIQLPHKTPLARPQPQAHSCWQIDVQEKVELSGYGWVNILDIVDTFTGIKIGVFLFPARQGTRFCKVSMEQYRQALRAAFARWGLPDRIRTDRERVLVPEGNYPYPSVFTLWLAGLSIEHELIRRVIENGSVERSHRTRFDRLEGYGPFTLSEWQEVAHYEVWRMNAVLPSRGRHCHRKPPLLIYPQAAQRKRYYHLAAELDLFDLEHVRDYLAQGKWLRHTSSKGQFSFHVRKYTLGVAWRSRWVQVTYLPSVGFQVTCPPATEILLTIALEDLTVEAITGLHLSMV
jgi:transposase